MTDKKGKISNENMLMIVLAFVAFSIGIWAKYRQLWLESVGFDVPEISRILSVALICSSVISFILSLFSSKIKVKNIILLSLIFRTFSMLILLFIKNDFLIKAATLLCVMCEVIFSIAFYPLLSFESRSNNAFKKKVLVDYFFKDIGIVICGFLFGVTIGKYIFDYNACLLIASFSSLCALFVIAFYKSNEDNYKKTTSLTKSLKVIMKSKVNRLFLALECVANIAYGVVFDLIMLILTNFIGFDVTFTSIFIIVCNILGTIFAYLISKISKNFSLSLSVFIKSGTRAIMYLIAFLISKNFIYIFAIIYAYIMTRILEDKVTGTFVEKIESEHQFLFGNMRYFVICLGEGIGAFIAGVLLTKSLNVLFLGAATIQFIHTFGFFYLDKIKKN